MKKFIFIAMVTLGITSAATAQRTAANESSSYQSAIGVRFGTGYYDIVSASYKTFLASTPGALELNLGFRPDTYYGADAFSVSLGASYQYHFDIPVDGLKWFVGGGISAYNTSVNNRNEDVHYSSGFGVGIFPTGGVDYKFATIPLNLTVDLRPTIGLVRPNDYYNYFYVSFGVAARYTIK